MASTSFIYRHRFVFRNPVSKVIPPPLFDWMSKSCATSDSQYFWGRSTVFLTAIFCPSPSAHLCEVSWLSGRKKPPSWPQEYWFVRVPFLFPITVHVFAYRRRDPNVKLGHVESFTPLSRRRFHMLSSPRCCSHFFLWYLPRAQLTA